MNNTPGRILSILFFFSTLGISAFAQFSMGEFSDSSINDGHHFFWYTGHWSTTKKHTFVIDSKNPGQPGSGGGTITINPDGKVHVQGGESDEWNQKINDGLKDLDQFRQETMGPAQEANELEHHMNLALKPFLDSAKSEWSGYKIDPKQDMLSPEQQGLQNLQQHVKDYCQQFRPRFNQIIQYYKDHKKDNENTVQNPLAPPELEEECTACDTAKQKEYDKKVKDFLDKFFQPEKDMVKDALGLLRSLMLIGRSTDFDGSNGASVPQDMADALENLFKPNKKDASQSGACAYIDTYDLINAIKFFPAHMMLRAHKLFKDYKTNFKVAKAVIRANMIANRQCALLGFSVDDADVFKNSASMIQGEYNYYRDKITKEHDWSQLSNLPFILDLTRGYYMMTNKELDIHQLFDIQNHFYMTLEMDLKVGRSGGYTYSHVKSKPVKIAPYPYYEYEDCSRWVVILDKPNELGYPMKDIVQIIPFHLIANEFHTGGESPEYKGTKEYTNHLQFLKLDFCNPGKDTILLTSILPEQQGGIGFFLRGYQVMSAGLAAGDRFFMNEKEMKELATSSRAKQQINKNTPEIQDKIAQARSLAAQIGNSHDSASLVKMNQIKDISNQVGSMNNNANLASMMYIVFLLDAQNKSDQLANKSFDAKQINAGTPLAEVIMHGEYKVKIEYRPKVDPDQE
ncbi:MAG: hypothetical protein ACHQET_05825 [Chitinophagales bacterium]